MIIYLQDEGWGASQTEKRSLKEAFYSTLLSELDSQTMVPAMIFT
jgi:hypothetical protein